MSRNFSYPSLLLLGVLIGISLGWVIFNQREKTQDQPAAQASENQKAENSISMTAQQAKRYGIHTRTADSGNLITTLSTRGKIVLHPDKLVHLLPKISGVSYVVKANLGDMVAEGQLLAIIESREMADLKASYLAALEKEKLTAATLERETELSKRKISAEQEFLVAKAAYGEAKINLELARQQLRALGFDDLDLQNFISNNKSELRFYEIRSPIKGTIIYRDLTQGELVENTKPIFEIADLSTVWIEIGIYPKDLQKIKEGQEIEISIPEANMSAQAKLIYISPIIEEETITAKAIAELDNPQRIWRPGSFVKANMSSKGKSVPLMVPREAIQNIDSKDYLFIKTSEGFEKRAIKTGQCDNDHMEILEGLNLGEEYAATQTFLLKADLGKNSVEHE